MLVSTVLPKGQYRHLAQKSWSRSWRNKTQYPLFCHFPFHLCSLFSGSHESHVRILSCDRRRIATGVALSGAYIQPGQTIMLNLVVGCYATPHVSTTCTRFRHNLACIRMEILKFFWKRKRLLEHAWGDLFPISFL